MAFNLEGSEKFQGRFDEAGITMFPANQYSHLDLHASPPNAGILDWFHNRHDPAAPMRAIEIYQASLLSNQKKSSRKN